MTPVAPPPLLSVEHVGVEFSARLRDTIRFAGPAPLVEQMGHDVAEVRRLLG